LSKEKKLSKENHRVEVNGHLFVYKCTKTQKSNMERYSS